MHCLLIFLNQHTDVYNGHHSFRQLMPCKINNAPSSISFNDACSSTFYTRRNAAQRAVTLQCFSVYTDNKYMCFLSAYKYSMHISDQYQICINNLYSLRISLCFYIVKPMWCKIMGLDTRRQRERLCRLSKHNCPSELDCTIYYECFSQKAASGVK